MVLGECSRVVVEVKLALHQKNPEFVEVNSVKLVWFSAFCVLQGFGGVATWLGF